MTPNTEGILTDTPIDDINNADQYSLLLCLKEVSFLIIILFFGFSGLSFCINKVYEPNSINKIEDIITHDLNLVDLNSRKTEANPAYSAIN